MTTIPTDEQIELMKGADLVATYNELAPLANLKTVKKFETREIAIRRTTQAAGVVRKITTDARESLADATASVVLTDALSSGSSVSAAAEAAIQAAKVVETSPGEAVSSAVGAKRGKKSSAAEAIEAKVAEVSEEAKSNPVDAVVAALKSGKSARDAVKSVTAKAAKSAAKDRGPSVASRCRELFAAGKDNSAIWDVVRAEFKLPDSKKWFVAWYRADERRKSERAAKAV